MGIAILTTSNASWPWSTTGGQTTITAELLGGGGGGGGVSNNTEEAGGGGRGGSYVRVTLTKGAESTLNITVGALGAAGAAAGGNGGSGGFSEINQNGTVVARAPGGAGGVGGTTNAGHAGGTTENGTEVHTGGTYFAGGDGASGNITSNFSGGGGGAAGPSSAGTTATTQTGGARGTGTWADGSTTRNTAGADGRTTGNAGQTPSDFGGGGSGGYATSATNRAGGAGAAGIVVLTWVDLTPSWRDLGELLSHQIAAPRKLDQRGYESAQMVNIAALSGPTDGTGGGRDGRPSSLPFMLRRVIERTTGPSDVFTTIVDQTVRTWMPAAAALLASAIPAAAKEDARFYDQQPNAAILPLTPVGPTDAQTFPAIQTVGTRTPGRPLLDIRAYDWTQAAPLSIVVDRAVATWAPASSSELASFRTPHRAALDVRRYDWDADESSWIRATQTPAPTVAQTSPAWTSLQQAFRTRSAAKLDLFRAPDAPGGFGVPDDWVLWAPVQDTGGIVRSRARLDVRSYEWRQFVQGIAAPAATTAQTVPAWAFDGDRNAARPKLDVRTYDWIAWVQGVAAPPASVNQTVPAWAFDGDRTGDRTRLDVRFFEWAPSFTWSQPVVDASIARLAPIFGSELASFRTGDRARLDVRAYKWAPDEGAWILVTFAPPATPAQYWPALLQNLGTQYQTPARAKLDPRRFDWQPAFTWPTRVVDGVVAKWIAVFDAEVSYRTPSGPWLDVRRITSEPQLAWLAAAIQFVPPPDATADVIILVQPDVGIIRVKPDVGIILALPDIGDVET